MNLARKHGVWLAVLAATVLVPLLFFGKRFLLAYAIARLHGPHAAPVYVVEPAATDAGIASPANDGPNHTIILVANNASLLDEQDTIRLLTTDFSASVWELLRMDATEFRSYATNYRSRLDLPIRDRQEFVLSKDGRLACWGWWSDDGDRVSIRCVRDDGRVIEVHSVGFHHKSVNELRGFVGRNYEAWTTGR